MTNSSDTIKAVGAGVAGAILLIVANGFKYLIQDILPHLLNANPGYEMSNLIGAFTYCLGMAVGLAVGCGAVWTLRGGRMSVRSAVTYSAIAGVVLGVLCFGAQFVYDFVVGPLFGGYSYSGFGALTAIMYSGMDVVMMAGLAIAGGTLYTVFVLKPGAVLAEAPIKG